MNGALGIILLVASTAASGPEGTLEQTLSLQLEDARARVTRLRAELAAAKTEAEAKVGQARARVRGLQSTLDRLTMDADILRRRVAELDAAESAPDPLALAMSEAARVLRLERGGGADLAGTIRAGLEHLATCGEIRSTRGEFFDLGGRPTKAEILWFGEVAALGIDRDGASLLVPVGDGQGLMAIDRVERPSLPGLAEVYLFDPEARSAPRGGERGLMATLEAGGPVVWPILGLGLVALVVILERLWGLYLLSRGRRRPAALVVAEVEALAGEPEDQVAARLQGTLDRERGRLERGLPWLGIVASVSPLLGLLGTVTGMISTFEVITTAGTGDPRLLSGGISEALITTELGLAVAIPVLVAHGIFRARVERLMDEAADAAEASWARISEEEVE